AFAMREDVVEADPAFTLGRAPAAEAQEAAKPAVGRPVGWEAEQAQAVGLGRAARRLRPPGHGVKVRADLTKRSQTPRKTAILAHQVEAGADEEADSGLPGGEMAAHHAGEAVAVGDRDRRMAERGGRRRQLVGMRSAAQKAEVAGCLQLDVGALRL